jgi:hypothetical protein
MKKTQYRKMLLTAGLLSSAWGALTNAQADFASQALQLQPIGYFRLNGTEPAEVPAKNLGTLGAAANGSYANLPLRGITGAIAGVTNTACGFDGTSQAVIVPWSKELNPSGAFTVEAWLNPGSDVSGLTAPLNAGHMADPRSGWLLYQNGTDGWDFRMYNQNGTSTSLDIAGGGPIATNTWYHVAVVYDGTAATLYVNGVFAASDTPSSYVANVDGPLTIGARSDLNYRWNGVADEVALYTNALSVSVIQAHYQSGVNASRAVSYGSLVLEQKPVVYLTLDEATPIAINSGLLGAAIDGKFSPGTSSVLPGPQSPAFHGFETTNYAVGFDGVGGYIKIPALGNLQGNNASFACWIKRDGAQSARAGILHSRVGSYFTTGLGFNDDGKSLSYNWNDASSDYNYNPGFVVPDNEWTFVAATITPDDAVLYMGTSAGLVASTNVVYHDLHDFSLAGFEVGWDNYSSTRYFKGKIDEICMYSKTLTYEEVSALFSSALPGFVNVTRTPADPVYEGMTVTFSAPAAGNSLSYQWSKDGHALSGKTNATLVLSNAGTNDSGSYQCVATSAAGTATTPALPLVVSAGPPIIVTQPASANRAVNGNVTFSTLVYGSAPLAYQWKHNQTAIAGATNTSLTIDELQASDAGTYQLVITNPYGSLGSDAVTLTIESLAAASPATLLNSGPVAYWRFDEAAGATSAQDCAGGHNATHTAVTTGAAGPRPSDYAGFDATNAAATYDGSTSKTTSGVSLLNNLKEFTLSGWIKLADTQVSSDRIALFGQNDLAEFGLILVDGALMVKLYTANGGEVSFDASNLIPGKWHHLAAVADGSSLSLYLDGESMAVGGKPTTGYGTSTDPFNIGFGVWDASGNYFTGAIDDVAVFDRALSAVEVKNQFTASKSVTTVPVVITQPQTQTAVLGEAAALSVEVKGGAPYTYQWRRNGTALADGTRKTLSFASVTSADSGSYDVVVTNGKGSVTSAAATLTVAPLPSYINLTNSLVMHLKFDGDYQDSSGRGNNGVAKGEPTFVTGKVGEKALHYSTDYASGIYNYVYLGVPADMQIGPGTNFTVAFWIRFTGLPGDLPFLCSAYNSTYSQGLTLAPSWQKGGWAWSAYDTSSNVGVGLYGPDYSINDGEWHNLVFVFDQGESLCSTYEDGALVDQTHFGHDLDLRSENNDFNIGQDPSGTYADGIVAAADMDDFGFWRRSLTAYEARAIYTAGEAGHSFDVAAPASQTLSVKRVGAQLELSWTAGTLEASDTVNGAYTTVSGASAPTYTVTPSNAAKFYRLKL